MTSNKKQGAQQTYVSVIWEDASRDSDRLSRRAALEYIRYTNETVGILLRRDGKCVIVAAERCHNDTYRDTLTIPRKMVKSITILAERK